MPRELWEEALEELPDSDDILDALVQKRCRGDLADPRGLSALVKMSIWTLTLCWWARSMATAWKMVLRME